MSTLKVSTIEPLDSDTTKTITIGNAGDTAAGVFTNTPIWRATITSQTIAYNTDTKIDYNQVIQDTNSAYDATNKRFTVPSGMGGTYMVGAWFRIGSATNVEGFQIFPFVNGAVLDALERMQGAMFQGSYNTIQASAILQLAEGATLEMYAKQNEVDANFNIGYSDEGMFWGYKLIGG
tara:strand:- start:27 stop:560 length:534 start_codon:yes stop_codon:yes gene_type:complete